MTAYNTPNDNFTAKNASFNNNNVGQLHCKLQCLQIIVYAITCIKITMKGTTVPLYEFAAKQPKKGHKLGANFFLQKLSTSKERPIKSTETRKG